MTQEEVAILWKDANGWDVRGYTNTLEDLGRFARLVAAKERENWPAEMKAMENQVNILTDELSKAAKWRNSAIRVGENLSTCGPEGYYDFTSAQWLGWALDATTKMQDDYMNLGACGEREACAKECEHTAQESDSFTESILRATATQIRARGEQA